MPLKIGCTKHTTKNDSELINLCVLDNKEPLTLYGDRKHGGCRITRRQNYQVLQKRQTPSLQDKIKQWLHFNFNKKHSKKMQ